MIQKCWIFALSRTGSGWSKVSIFLCLLTSFWWGCSESSNQNDGGILGDQEHQDLQEFSNPEDVKELPDFQPMENEFPADQSPPADLDLKEQIGIWVPEGTKLCSLSESFPESNNPVEAMLGNRQVQHQLALKPGLVKLSKSEGSSIDLDWVEQLEMGPDRSLGQKDGLGSLDYLSLEGSWQGARYQQSFSTVGGQMTLTIELISPNGQDLFVLDGALLRQDGEDIVFNARSQIEGNQNWYLSYTTCDLSVLDLVRVEVGLEGDASLQLDYRCPTLPLYVILSTTCSCLMEKAKVQIANTEQTATDSYDMVFASWNHCNLSQSTLVVLPEALDGAYGFFLSGGANIIHGGEPTEVQLLGSDLTVKETKKIISWSQK